MDVSKMLPTTTLKDKLSIADTGVKLILIGSCACLGILFGVYNPFAPE